MNRLIDYKLKQHGIYIQFQFNSPKYDSIPQHYVVILGGTTDPCRRVLLQPLEVSHQPLPSRSRHCRHLQNPTPTIDLNQSSALYGEKKASNIATPHKKQAQYYLNIRSFNKKKKKTT